MATSMISLGTVALLQHPDVFELLGRTDDTAVVANIVEELMRYLTIVHSQVDRVATEDLTLGGELIRAGDFLLMNLPAGNWDPAFVDDPALLDTDRNTRGHLGFGFGVHQCIGAEPRPSRDAGRAVHVGPSTARTPVDRPC